MYCQLYVFYFHNYVGKRAFYGLYSLSYILYIIFFHFSFLTSVIVDSILMTADQGCGYTTRQSIQPWVLSMC
jgi:hypothetical protein